MVLHLCVEMLQIESFASVQRINKGLKDFLSDIKDKKYDDSDEIIFIAFV